jgi:hypothetical protein
VNPAWVAAAAALSTLVLAIAGWFLRGAWRGFRKAEQFLEDWNGIPADPGHERRPGVMERLAQLEHGMTDIRGEVHLNSGHSLRDEVQRTEAAVGELTVKLDKVEMTVNELKARS